MVLGSESLGELEERVRSWHSGQGSLEEQNQQNVNLDIYYSSDNKIVVSCLISKRLRTW